MSEDYQDSLRTERHDNLLDYGVDGGDEFDYAEFYAWVSRQPWAPEPYRTV